jgi:hypothetical protein
MTNPSFFEQHAKPGMVGLVGGSTWIDMSIRRAQKAITNLGEESNFSHAFIIGEKRADGHFWVFESDLEIHRKQMKLGVQENRLEKYFDENQFPNIALLDFDLSASQTQEVFSEALNLIANRTQYSIREIFGVLLSFTNKRFRSKENILAQDKSYFCSAMVQHCFAKVGTKFSTNVSLKHLAPDDIYSTGIKHKSFELIRKSNR